MSARKLINHMARVRASGGLLRKGTDSYLPQTKVLQTNKLFETPQATAAVSKVPQAEPTAAAEVPFQTKTELPTKKVIPQGKSVQLPDMKVIKQEPVLKISEKTKA